MKRKPSTTTMIHTRRIMVSPATVALIACELLGIEQDWIEPDPYYYLYQ